MVGDKEGEVDNGPKLGPAAGDPTEVYRMKMAKLKPEKVVDNLDRNLAVLGLIASLALIPWLVLAVGKHVEIGVLFFLACATYLAIRKRLFPLGISSLQDLYAKRSTYLILNLLFFILFFYSIISVILRADLYSRPLGYFVSTALMTTILAIEILFLPKGKAYTFFVMVKIMLIALSLRWIPQFIFPGLIGVDPWAHQMFTTGILEAGRIPEGNPYSNLPVMHLIIAATSLITDLDYKFATMFSISFLQVIGLVFVFLLGRFIFNSKVGLLAALLLGVAEWWINLGMAIHPTALALFLVLLLIYVLFKARETGSIALTSLALVTMGVLILTHSVTTLTMAILLFMFWLGFEIYKKVYRERFNVPVTLGLSVLFAVGMLTWWVYACGWSINITGFMTSLWIERGAPVETYTDYWSKVSPSENMLYMLGFVLFWAFSVIGSLYMLAKRFGNRHGFALVLGGLGLVAILLVDFARGMSLSAVFAHRWWWSLHLIMAIPAAIGFLTVCAWLESKFIRALVLAILISIMSFLSITAPMANFDNRVYTENIAARYAFTESELSAMDAISSRWDGTVGVATSSAQYYFAFDRDMPAEEIASSLYAKDFSDCTNMIVIVTEEVVNNYFAFAGGGMKLNYDPREVLEEQGFDRIYDCRSVSAFLKP